MIPFDKLAHGLSGDITRRIVITVRIPGGGDIHLPPLAEESALETLRLLLAPHTCIPGKSFLL